MARAREPSCYRCDDDRDAILVATRYSLELSSRSHMQAGKQVLCDYCVGKLWRRQSQAALEFAVPWLAVAPMACDWHLSVQALC